MPINEDAYVGCTLNFEHRLKGRRIELGLTQNDLGKLVGVSKTTIQSYESGNIPKGLNLFRLSRALKCSIDYLLLGEESPYIQKEWIAKEPFGMSKEELANYHSEIKGTWLEQYVFYKSYESNLYNNIINNEKFPSDLPHDVVELLKMTHEIIMSDTSYSQSLKDNIRSFHQAVSTENRLQDIEDRLSRMEAGRFIANSGRRKSERRVANDPEKIKEGQERRSGTDRRNTAGGDC